MVGFCDSTMFYNSVSNCRSGRYVVAYLGNLRVRRKEAPVDICSVTNIGVIVLCCCGLKHLLYKTLVAPRLFQEEFHDCCQYL